MTVTSRQAQPLGTAVNLTAGTTGTRRVFARAGSGAGYVYVGGSTLAGTNGTGATATGGQGLATGDTFGGPAGVLLADGDHLYGLTTGPRIEVIVIDEPAVAPTVVVMPAEPAAEPVDA